MRLSGKTIVVVGGTGGIGSEVAREAVREGAKVNRPWSYRGVGRRSG